MEFKLNSNREAKNVNNKYNTYGYVIIMKNTHSWLYIVLMCKRCVGLIKLYSTNKNRTNLYIQVQFKIF